MKRNNLLLLAFILLISVTIASVTGCRKHEPKVTEKAVLFVNDGTFSPGGSIQIVLDGSGYVNGERNVEKMHLFNSTIVHYTGAWSLDRTIPTKYEPFYMAISTTPGDRVDMVATMTAVTFNFLGKDWFADAGDVSFYIDDNFVNSISFKSDEADTYILLMPEPKDGKYQEHKVSLVVNSGGVCISGYVITVPVIKRDFYQEMLDKYEKEKKEKAQKDKQANP